MEVLISYKLKVSSTSIFDFICQSTSFDNSVIDLIIKDTFW